MAMLCRTIAVTLGDGTRLVVAEENWLTGVKLLRLQRAAFDEADKYPDIERKYFHFSTYPKLVAAVVEGTPPSEEDTIMMPSKEMGKWYDAVKELNPQWFEEVPVDGTAEAKAENEKKRKPRKRK